LAVEGAVIREDGGSIPDDIKVLARNLTNGTFGTEHIRHLVTKDEIIGVVSLEVTLLTTPKKDALLANYPNPFNPDTWIPYQLASAAEVKIKIYNIAGQLVRELDLGHKAAGFYINKDKAAYWDGRNGEGKEIASGVYFYVIEAGKLRAVRKMVLAK
jgi:hypothetical protein